MSAGSSHARQLTPDEAIHVVSRHGAGVPVALIADQFGVPNQVIKAAIDKAAAARAARNGVTLPVAAPSLPKVAAVEPDPAPAGTGSDAPPLRIDPADLYTCEELCEWADDVGIHRAEMLAERIRSSAAELRSMVRRRGEIDSGRAKVAEAERILAEARDQLAKITGSKVASTAPGETAAIRAWANQHGHELPERGRISADIIAAYRAAH